MEIGDARAVFIWLHMSSCSCLAGWPDSLELLKQRGVYLDKLLDLSNVSGSADVRIASACASAMFCFVLVYLGLGCPSSDCKCLRYVAVVREEGEGLNDSDQC